jgi:hypothetical protein
MNLFNISCIQISDNEVLIISSKEFFKFDIRFGEIIYQGILPIKSKSQKVGYPIRHKNNIFCVVATNRLIRYNILKDRWDVLSRNPNCCCSII